MAKTKTYSYKVIDLADPSAVLDELKKTKGVIDAEFADETLTYVLDEWTDEYDILVTALNLCDSLGAELIVGEEESASDYDYDAVILDDESQSDLISEPEKMPGEPSESDDEKESIPDSPKKKKNAGEEGGDYVVTARKNLKSASIVRFIELSASFLIFIISLFFKDDATTFFTFKNILLIMAFAISAYEAFYLSITDIVKKRWLSESIAVSVASIAGALIARLTETTALLIIYSIAKEINTYVNGLNKLRIDEAFYTGSLPVRLLSGGEKRKNEIEEGDVICLGQYEILPCDCEILSAATFDCHAVGGGIQDAFAAGDKVLAGSLLVSESITAKVVAVSDESFIVKEKNAFTERLSGAVVAPKWANAATLILYAAALLVSLIPPVFSADGYGVGLVIYAAIGVLIAFIANINYVISSTFNSIKTALILFKINGVEYDDVSSLKKLGEANSFVFDAAALTDNGQVKEDAIGALKELMSLGVRNVTTDFSSTELDESVRKKIDFIDKSFDGEKKVAVGEGKDVSLGKSGGVVVKNGEISFVPYSYKVAKKAFKAKKIAAISNVFGYVLSVLGAVALIVFPLPIGVTIAAAPALIAQLVTALSSLSVARIRL